MTRPAPSAVDHRIGVDLGGTKIEAIVLRENAERDEPHVITRERVPTDRFLGYDHIVLATAKLIMKVAQDTGVDPLTVPIGIGMPGSVTTRRADGSRSEVPLVKNSNTTCLNGQPFRQDLMRTVGREISFANDANCFALAEARWGAARGARITFGLILGTGAGGGLVFTDDGGRPRAWEGAHGIAGEWGHVPLEPDTGPNCYCGKRGCVETFLSGPSIEAAYKARGGSGWTLAQIAKAAAAGEDPIARTLIDERLELFGRAVAMVINIVDPDVIVIGGGVSNVAALYDKGVHAVAHWIFNEEVVTRIVKNTLGDSAGVLGAALLPVGYDARATERDIKAETTTETVATLDEDTVSAIISTRRPT